MEKHKDSQGSVRAKAKRHSYTISQSTIGRILNQQTYATLESIEGIADIYGLLPWQLLVPELDVGNPPVLRELSQAEKDFYEKFKALAKEFAK